MQGYLQIKIHIRRKRFCVLEGRTFKIYKSKQDYGLGNAPRKEYNIVAVKDLKQLEKSTAEILIGTSCYKNALVITAERSKVIVAEAQDEQTQKDWISAINELNLPVVTNTFLTDKLNDSRFDAHTAVSLLYKFKHDTEAVSRIVERLSDYAQENLDDVEFYLQQIVYLMVYMDSSKTDGLIKMLLSACQAKVYQENLGNSIHIALQLFWYLQGLIQDNQPEMYNKCAKILLSVEAHVVDQQFDVKDVSSLVDDIPGLQEKLFDGAQEDNNTTKKDKILKWLRAERQKRYKYFEAQRDFIRAITNVSEMLRLVDPSERKALLPKELYQLDIPELSYIPLGKASDPFFQILRVLENEVVKDDPRSPSIFQRYQGKYSISSVGDDDSEIASIIHDNEMGYEWEDSNQSPSASFSSDRDVQLQEPYRSGSIQYYSQGLSKMLQDFGAFGESWEAKKQRLRQASPHGHLAGWNVISLISKSNDDMRQEVFALQLISKFQDIFQANQLSLWLRPYRIISTGNSTGLIETITDAQSLDGLKCQAGYTTLKNHFRDTYGDEDSEKFKTARSNFLQSLVAYSIVSYILQIKDRHNGNLLLTTDGHLVHIDFGFLLGSAPGGSWSIETAPFKLTKEMVDVLGGVKSEGFDAFVRLFISGMLAVQRNADKITILVEIMMKYSSFSCFEGRDMHKTLARLKERIGSDSSKEKTVAKCVRLIHSSYNNKWTARYDKFQKLTNGIMP